MPLFRKKHGENLPPPLTRNTISYVGWAITIFIGGLIAVLIIADYLYFRDQPYNSLITYLVLPVFMAGGVCLILLGGYLEWRRRHKQAPDEYTPLPIFNLNLGWQRRRALIGAGLLALFVGVSAIGSYRAYQFTESPQFCGLVCHQVMIPEYTTYQHSPHARVSCAECHIGSGADWYVKSKLSGLRQVWAVATNSYTLPIPAPVANLRPARETCEECHWPEKFSDPIERVIWRFEPDEANTPNRYHLLLKIGGGLPEAGQGGGIHWHVNPNVEVRYWASDEKRMIIPWVEVRIQGQEPKVFRSPDCPDPLPEDAEIRMMDCVDCHNRPSHIYRSPRQLIDSSLSNGVLNASLPYLKRRAMQLFEQKYEDTPSAMKAIEQTLETDYASLARGPEGEKLVRSNIELLQSLYRENFFPEQGVDWREYPNHLGHFEFPGCGRCHNDEHRTAANDVISNDCNLCHEIVVQARGAEAFQAPVYSSQEYRHPQKMDDIWRGTDCTQCHAIAAPEAPIGDRKEPTVTAMAD